MSWHGSPSKKPFEDDDENELPQFAEDEYARPPGVENKASPPFSVVVKLLSKCEALIGTKTSAGAPKAKTKGGKKSKSDHLREFYAMWRREAGPDLYPVIRLLLPDRDSRRRNYNLKEQKLAKALVKALDIPSISSHAIQMMNWKVPVDKKGNKKSGTVGTVGDFSTVALEPINVRSTTEAMRKSDPSYNMSIDETNDLLDELSKAGTSQRSINAPSSPEKGKGKGLSINDMVAEILEKAFQKLLPEEMKWLLRIILKGNHPIDLKIGFSEKLVLGAMHEDAVDLFNTCSDILRVCWELHDPKHRIEDERKQITVGSAFSPMLCSHLTPMSFDAVVAKMTQDRALQDKPPPSTNKFLDAYKAHYWCGPKEFLLEEKFDGERIQVHKKENTYTYFSRTSYNYTKLYGATPEEGSITPYIHDHIASSVEECVLDAEMLVWDPKNTLYVPFGQLKSFAVKTSFSADDPRPCLKVFDLLYLKTKQGGQSLLNSPNWHRKALLHTIFKPKPKNLARAQDFKIVPGILEIAPVHRATCVKDISEFLNQLLEQRGEGMVVKSPTAAYILGGRVTTWIKIKPDYMDMLGHDLDALVVGAYWGQGRRGGGHASFLLAVKDPNGPEQPDGTPQFRSFAKVGSGFDRPLFEKIKERTEGMWFNTDKYKLPGWFSTNTELPDQMIHPQKSFVIIVRAAEVVQGKDYGAGLCLRFPRCMGLRDDKDWTDCATISELETLQNGPKKRPNEEEEFVPSSKKKGVSRSTKPKSVVPAIKAQRIDQLFSDIVFYVHTFAGSSRTRGGFDKPTIRKLIVEHGGQERQAISALAAVEDVEQKLVVATEWSGNLPSIPEIDLYDVVKPQWIAECVAARTMVPMLSKHYVRMLEPTKRIVEASEQRARLLAAGGFDDAPFASQTSEVDSTASTATLQDDAIISQPVVENNDVEEDPLEVTSSAVVPRDRDLDSDDDTDADSDPGRFDAVDQNSDLSDDNDSGDEQDADGDVNFAGPPSSIPFDLNGLDVSDSSPTKVKKGLLMEEIDKPKEEEHYDPDQLFAQFVAYFDTPENAERNGLAKSTKSRLVQAAAKVQLEAAETVWKEHNGRVTENLLDPALTHIFVDGKIKDRITKMIQLTSRPPLYRRIVSPEWIQECIDAEDLVDEKDYQP